MRTHKPFIIVVFTLSIVSFFACDNTPLKEKEFTLSGTFKGNETEYLILSYMDSSANYKRDTIQVIDERFNFKGNIYEPQMVTLTSDRSKNLMEDPNRLRFFIEPNEIVINLTENEFKKAQVTGSKTQNDKIALDNSTQPLQEELNDIRAKQIPILTQYRETASKSLKKELDDLEADHKLISDEIMAMELDYVLNHPSSYYSAYLINFYKENIPPFELESLYGSLSAEIKESKISTRIKTKIDKNKTIKYVDTGDKAPAFSGENLAGDITSLSDYNDKVVLLDFGADWCAPCKKDIPKLKSIYSKYQHLGFEILGISVDKNQDIWRESVKKHSIQWDFVYEGLSRTSDKVRITELYSVRPIPAYILIDGNGIIIDRYRFADEDSKSLDQLDEYLAIHLASD